jgi:predicted esterase
VTTPSGPEPTAVEHHVEVTRTARYWTLGDTAEAEDVWFVLHGYKQLARRFLRRFEPIAAPGRLIVAPEALSRFYARPEPGRHGPSSVVGASWMTREDRLNEIRDYVAYLDRVAQAALPSEPSTVTVLGFSQGTATAARWVSMGDVRADRLVLWAGYVPHDQDLERAADVFGRTELALVRGEEDPGLTAELDGKERELLESAGVAWRTVRYAGGHEIDPTTLRELAGESPRTRP